MEKLTQLQNQSSEKSSKSFKKIPTKYQNIILVAASIGEITALHYDADAAEFFKCSNNLNAQVMLNSLLEAEGIDCSILSAVTATLLMGVSSGKTPFHHQALQQQSSHLKEYSDQTHCMMGWSFTMRQNSICQHRH